MRNSTRMLFICSLFTSITSMAFADEPIKGSLKILVPMSTASLPFLLLADDDPVPELDIRTEIFLNHPKALIQLIRGEADMIFTGTSQGWENYLNGGPLVMVNTGNWGVSYLIGRDKSISNFTDLKGKRIALPFPGSPLDFQTRYILRSKGIDPDKDLKLSYSPPLQTVSRLLLGQVDAAPLPEPLASDGVINKGLSRLIDYKQAWAELSGGDPMSPQVSLFAHKSVIHDRNDINDIIEKLVCHWRKACITVIENPEQTAVDYSEALGLSEEIIAMAIGNTLFSVPSFEENRKRVLIYYDEIKELLVGNHPPLGKDFFFEPSNE